MQQEQWTRNWQCEQIRIGTDCCRLSAGAKKYIGGSIVKYGLNVVFDFFRSEMICNVNFFLWVF